MPDERLARRALAAIVDGGDVQLSRLVALRGPVEAWSMIRESSMDSAWTRRARALDLGALLAAEEAAALRFVIPADSEWPAGLTDLERCEPLGKTGGRPMGLWVRGRLSLDEALAGSIAIVGARASSSYGERVASDFAAELARLGHTIVSGAAYGIDAAAHRGALSEDGLTVAFLANGADRRYPGRNTDLIDRIAGDGLVVSEYPPGEHPTKARFLARNRLIAAASLGTVIVEASYRSGALNTANWAGRCGRQVMAVPGSVFSAQSEGTHHLVRNKGAVIVTSADDVRELVTPLGTVDQIRPSRERLLDRLTAEQRAAYEALPSRGERGAGEVALKAGLVMPQCLAALSGLAELGLVERTIRGAWKLGKITDRPMLPLDGPGRTPAS